MLCQDLFETANEHTLRPAIRYDGQVYIGRLGGDHLSALQAITDPGIRGRATLDGDDRGFVTERGRFLNRMRAQTYAVKYSLIRDGAPAWVFTAKELIAEWLQTWLDRMSWQ